MNLIDPEVARYLESLVPARAAELEEMEQYARDQNFPIIGPVAGHLCYLIARLTGARRVFELGSGFGYSTAFFGRAVLENGGGEVHHVVWDDDLSGRARAHLAALGLSGVVRYHVSEAVEALRRAGGRFDIIFNDIDKEGYPGSLDVIEEKLRPGGVLIVDNMLWSGRVLDSADRTASTDGVREMTRRIVESGRWIHSLVPIRDGIIVAMYDPPAPSPRGAG